MPRHRISAITFACWAVESSIGWIDCQSRQGCDELLSVRSDRGPTASTSAPPDATPRSYRSGSGENHQARALQAVPLEVFFSGSISQFVMANELPHAYDFFHDRLRTDPV